MAAAAFALAALTGCGSDAAPKPSESKDIEVGVDLILPDVTATDASAADSTDAGSAGSDTGVADASSDVELADATDDDADASATDDAAGASDGTSGCKSNAECSNLPVAACEEAQCTGGKCVAVAKPAPWCCSNTNCDDGDSCTADSCDSATSQCLHVASASCCAGQVTLAKLDFEGDLDGLVASTGPDNGSGPGQVSWQVSADRRHTGTSALYFGNACKNYDTSATTSNQCQGDGNALAVSGDLTSPEYALPPGKPAHVHFWLFLDAEPPYSADFAPGQCATPCPANSSCVVFNGVSQCLPEKDLLTLDVLEGGKSWPVFISLSMGKTTAGGWQRVAADLGAFAGKKIRLRWRFDSVTGYKNAYEGVWLDDVVVETLCPALTCTTGATCGDDGNSCTLDTCTTYSNAEAGAGACLYSTAPQCCLSAAACSDGNACTVDSCQNATCSNVPDASQPSCCSPASLLAENFDSGLLTGWTPFGLNSVLVRWRTLPGKGRPDLDGVTATTGLAFSNESGTSYADPGVDAQSGPKGSLCTKQVKLASGTLYNLASFWLRLDTEWSGVLPSAYANPPVEGLVKFDELTLQVYQAGKFDAMWSSDTLKGSTVQGSDVWKKVVVDLSKYAGKTVQVCLTFDAGDGQQNDYAGPVVDEFRLDVACSKSVCDGPESCANCDDPAAVPLCSAASGCSCP